MDKFEIIERIGYFRVKAKLSQKALSINIGMNEGYINRLESKKDFLPSLDVLLKIIDACDITEEEFFYGNVHEYERDKMLIEKIKYMPQDKKDALLNFMSVISV
jgi:transcriptional regulator with XRE-family HTH domain